MTTRRLTPTERHQICATAPINERTLDRILTGKEVKPISLHRVRAAAAALNLTDGFDPLIFSRVLGPATDLARSSLDTEGK